jgi:hypothetical protein
MQAAGEEGRGVFWLVRSDCELGHVVSHDGTIDGFHATVILAPQKGLGFIALCNAREPEGLDDAARQALAVVARSLSAHDPSLDSAVDVVKKLLAEPPTEDLIRSSFSPAFLAVKSVDETRAFWTTEGQTAGACGDWRYSRSRAGFSFVRLSCEKTDLEVGVVPSATPHMLDGVIVRAVSRCTP